MNEIALNLTMDEGKVIFRALTELPFKLVFELLGKLNEQTNVVKSLERISDEQISFYLTKAEIDIVSEALSKQPFKRVHKIMEKIYQQKNFPVNSF